MSIEHGWVVTPKPQESLSLVPGSVAIHEAQHIVAGSSTKRATITPGPGYLGMTEFNKFSPIGAIAPYAFGSEGAGYDVWLLRQLGYDIGSLARVARRRLYGREDEIYAVASLLQERRTISGHEAEVAMYEATRPRFDEVEIETPWGEQFTITVRNEQNTQIEIVEDHPLGEKIHTLQLSYNPV